MLNKNKEIKNKINFDILLLAVCWHDVWISNKKLAKIKGISRARITQILNLLKLGKNAIDNLEQIGDPMDKKVISERELRKIIHLN